MAMEPEVEERFQRIEAILHAMAQRENHIEARFNKRMDRMEQRHEEAMLRLAKTEHQVEVTGKLVHAGMKVVIKLGDQVKAFAQRVDAIGRHVEELSVEVKALAKSQKAFLDSMRRGGNGHGSRRPA